MIISIGGSAGSGKSTIAQLLVKRLGLKHHYMGALRREAARRRGLTIEEYNRLGETDPSTDTECDRFQQELGQKEDGFVIEGRTSFHFIPHSVKVYLSVDADEAARRLMNDEKKGSVRNERVFETLEQVKENMLARDRSDALRYQKFYGIDPSDKRHYDLVIDTTKMHPQQVLDRILHYLQEKGHI